MSRRRRPYRIHRAIDAVLPFVLLAAGAASEAPITWYACFAVAFATLAGVVLGGAAFVTWVSGSLGTRIQGPRRKRAPMGREAFETARAMWVAAALAAWPIMMWRLGQPTGMVVDLGAHEIPLWRVLAQTFVGIVVIDGWLYLKHRILHTKAMFGFHRGHHAFRDPTAFAGFAVAPVEALMTFWPILFLCMPEATHWAPLYFGLVGGFIALNFYLHCGVTLRFAEASLPRLLLNTSAFHNIHHSHANANFGEPLRLWDIICKTRLQDLPHVRALAQDEDASPQGAPGGKPHSATAPT